MSIKKDNCDLTIANNSRYRYYHFFFKTNSDLIGYS